MKKTFLFFLLSIVYAVAWSQATVNGIVVDAATGEPVIGAAIQAKGASVGTVSDINGRFVLSVPEGIKMLVVSYLGYNDQEVTVAQNLRVLLTESTKDLDEVMVVAYGTAKKSSFAGSASLVSSRDMETLTTTSFENALAGKVAGVQLTQASGQVGSTPAIRIRGVGSMNAGNEPLYVIDGVPVSGGNLGQADTYTYSSNDALALLNPDDIESISVLKDAAASSLYGSRAANGVVIITTKKGKNGKPQVGIKVSAGFTPCWATDNYETASLEQQVDMLYTVFYDAGLDSGKDAAGATDYAIGKLQGKFNKHGYDFQVNGTDKYQHVEIIDYDNSGRAGNYYDWNKAYYRTAAYQTYDFTINGGNDHSTYFSSLSYTKDQGRIKVNNFDRLTARVNLQQKAGKWFQFDTDVNFSRTARSGYNDTRNTGNNLFMQTRNLLWGMYHPTDYKTGEEWTSRYGSYAYNQLYYQNQWENSSTTHRLQGSERVTFNILPMLKLSSLLSYDYRNVRDHVYYSSNHFTGSSDAGIVHELNTESYKWVSSTTLAFNQTFQDAHTLGLLAGFEVEKNSTSFVRATGKGLPASGLHTVATAGVTESNAYDWGYALMSVLAKADYNYLERYFLSASYRTDASSKLAPAARWGHFWSVAGAYRIVNEDFMEAARQNAKLSELKLRVSYGVNGTLPSAYYGYMNLMSYTAKYNGETGGIISSLANEGLSWETSYTTNVGLDFGFFGQRLRGTIEYFNRSSKNLLQDVPVSTTTGFTSTLQNVGEIRNYGVDFELVGDIIRTKDWTWTLGINGSAVRNKVTKLYGGQDIIWYDPTGGDDRAQYIYSEGQPVLSFYGYEWAGVDSENGKSVYYTNDGTDGDFLFNDRGATYSYKKAERVIIGNATPKLAGGLNTTVAWRGLALDLNFIYKIGGELYDGAYKDVADDGYYWERIRAKSYYENMWTPTHTSGTQPALAGTDLEDAMQYSSRHISGASFFRLKNMSLSYSLPKQWIAPAYLSTARVFFTASNLFTFSKYKEADPEVNEYGTRGWETPLGKTFVFGVELKF